jgi:tripartite-type tricarboxylate transporter receptor subunit TctC
VINASTPATDVKGLIALGKAAPNPYSFGSNGNGTAQHLIGTQFEALTGMPLLHIPYKGSGPLTTDLLGGQVQMSFDTITPVLPHIKSGKLRALAVTTGKRSSALARCADAGRSGSEGFDAGTWFGVLAPAATPKDVAREAERRDGQGDPVADFRQRMARSAPSRSATRRADGASDQGRHRALRALVRDAKVSID